MNQSILYLGDTSLDTAASYLAGCLACAGHEFEYLPSDQSVTPEYLGEPHQLYIISDFPAANFPRAQQEQLVEHIRNGSNLLMIGGWESFHGSDGHWQGTPVAELLPVLISDEDDRRNCDAPVFVSNRQTHPITADLPWNDRPPLIGGYNKVVAKPSAETLLFAEVHSVVRMGETYRLEHRASDPLLVVEELGSSRVAALMTDLAPHWVGPLVDWGDGRVTAQAPGANSVEVGEFYFRFVTQLIDWVGQFES